MTNASQRSQIRNLLAVLAAAVLAAGAISSWMLYHYNPSGIYYAQNVLLAPQLLGQAPTSKKGGMAFQGVEYIYAEGSSEQKINLTKNLYQAFYDTIAPEKSLDPVSDDVIAKFGKGKVSRLVLKVQKNGSEEDFQEVHFAPQGDFYRVQLRMEGDEGNWAYFYHPGIAAEVRKLFTARLP